ncbi:MAG TPA: MarR family transcriptional regulator [Actinospica sp.]|nr:MarR family transcriptional regulator [Actinospica sp.]
MSNDVARAGLLGQVAAEAPAHAAAAVRLNIAVANQLGLPHTDVQCIGLLTGGPAAPTRLAERLGLTTGAMTKVLDRLEHGGYVHRSADPADRRRIVVTASDAGLAEAGRHYAPIGEAFARRLAGYTDNELRTVLKFMRDGREVAEAEIDRIRGAGTPHAARPR